MSAALDRFFLPAAADRARLPVALLSGGLGAGKTTLVNALLRDPRLAETAVAVNEFGAIPVDHHLIDHGADRTVVLANGCLCCNLAGDLEDAVMRVFSRQTAGELPRFARLIVEPSGLADPAPIAQAILRNPAMTRSLRFDGIVTVVDALFGERAIDADPVATRQIGLADRIVLTKTDLAAADATARLRDRLATLNPVAPVLDVRHGAVDPAALFSPHFLDPAATPPPPRRPSAVRSLVADTPGAPSDHGAAVATVLTADAPLDWHAFDTWLRRRRIGLEDRLLRVKGLIHVAGASGPVVIQGVHHVLHPPVLLEAWPDGDRSTRLVLITRGATIVEVAADWPGQRRDPA